MTQEELVKFNEADQVMHPVEGEWHYKILSKYGFVPETKTARGFVRYYKYVHPDGRIVTTNTGCNADYWSSNNGDGGYWSALESYCMKG